MTCRDLGGACDVEFQADSFDQMAQLSRQHGMEMMQQGDAPHLEAMHKMQDLMKDPNAMSAWFTERKAAFDALPNI